MPGSNSGDNVSAALGLDGLDLIDESGADEGNEGGGDEGTTLEASYDLTDPPGDDVEVEGEGQPTGRKQLVPLGALQEERNRRQELQQKLEAQAATQQAMQDRFNEMMMRLQGVQTEKPAVEEEVIPDFNDDPAAHVEGLKRQFAKQLAELQASVQQTQGTTQQQQYHQQLAQAASAAEVEFTKVKPDYNQAADFFKARKMAEYAAFGLDPASAAQQLARDCTGIVQGASQRGANPAEVLYNLANALGYTPAAAPQVKQGQQGLNGKPKAPTSLANASGAPKAPDEDNGGNMTLEKVANMSDAEFDKFFTSMSKGSTQRPKY